MQIPILFVGGHYIANAKNCIDSKWYEFNDSFVGEGEAWLSSDILFQFIGVYIAFQKKMISFLLFSGRKRSCGCWSLRLVLQVCNLLLWKILNPFVVESNVRRVKLLKFILYMLNNLWSSMACLGYSFTLSLKDVSF